VDLKKKLLEFLEFYASKIAIDVGKRTYFNSIRYLEHKEIVDSAEFIGKHLDQASLFVTKKSGYFQFAMGKLPEDLNGLWLEFGVREGNSAKFFAPFAEKFALNQKLYAFDSFQGLRNDWSAVGVPKEVFVPPVNIRR